MLSKEGKIHRSAFPTHTSHPTPKSDRQPELLFSSCRRLPPADSCRPPPGRGPGAGTAPHRPRSPAGTGGAEQHILRESRSPLCCSAFSPFKLPDPAAPCLIPGGIACVIKTQLFELKLGYRFESCLVGFFLYFPHKTLPLISVGELSHQFIHTFFSLFTYEHLFAGKPT